jgi:hypothetical protein
MTAADKLAQDHVSSKPASPTLLLPQRTLSAHSYNKTNEMQKFLKFIFWIELYMFLTGFLSIIRSLALYKQQ